MKNPYEILNVPTDADEAQIKKAFRSKARQSHPDAGGSPEAFKEVSEAYEILSNSERRKRFDESGRTYEMQDLEKQVHEKIRHMIVLALESCDYETDDLFDELKKSVDFQISKIRSEEHSHSERKAKFSKSSKKIGRKDGERNIAIEALADQISLAQSRIDLCHKKVELMEAILVELEKYHWTYDKSGKMKNNFTGQTFAGFTITLR